VKRAGLALLLAAASLGGCAKRPPAPKVAAGERRADFGPLWIGEERVHDFPCRNDGDAPLTFGEVRATCGCLLAEVDRRDLAPGATRLVKVKFSADKGLDRVEKELRVATNDPATPWLVFTLAAEVHPLYLFTPPAAIWKELVLGEAATQQVAVAVADGSAVHFVAPKVEEPGFAAGLATTPAGAAAAVAIRFDGKAKVGTHLFHVVLPGDHPRVAQALIPVEATILGRLDFPEGDRVDFGEVAAARGASVTRRVRGRGSSALALDHPAAKVVLSGSRNGVAPIELRWRADEAGRAWSLDLSIAPGATAQTLVGRVDVTLPGTDEPVHSLTLAGRIVAR
jgi:uncharacterized protein DUF1573